MKPVSGDLLVIVPSMRISGGVTEVLRLAETLAHSGINIQILSLWKKDIELPHRNLPVDYATRFPPSKRFALLQYPLILISCLLYLHRRPSARARALMVTHFTTFPIAWMAPALRWYCFNQDIEWMFVPPGPARIVLRWFILATSRRSRLITTNYFIESQYLRQRIQSVAQVAIWPSEFWLSDQLPKDRPVDLVMLLRKGRMKRLDLYLDLLSLLESRPGISCAVVTPDPDLHGMIEGKTKISLLGPDNYELRRLYGQSKIFISLSDTEGFGLTALEAMGQGCVPLCRDSGGVRSYMTGQMQPNLIPLSEPVESILTRIEMLLADPRKLAASSVVAEDLFREGLVESNARKAYAIKSLVEMLEADRA